MSDEPLLNTSEAVSIACPGEKSLPQHKVEDPSWACQICNTLGVKRALSLTKALHKHFIKHKHHEHDTLEQIMILCALFHVF